MNIKDLGVLGEKIASKYLEKKGYKVLGQNYSPRFVSGPLRGEVDIIAKKDNIISFVEVKTLVSGGRSSGSYGGQASGISPEERVDYSKQKKLMKMAESWLTEKKFPLDSPWQIDVISIKIDLSGKKARIQHFQNAVF